MIVRVVSAAILAWSVGMSGVLASSIQEEARTGQAVSERINTQDRALADLEGSGDAFVLSASQPTTHIRFSLPPGTVSSEAWLQLAARPASDGTDGRIRVSVNGGEAIVIRPQARAMEARFALFSADLRPGENVLEIAYSTENAAPGWIVDARRSRLRLTLEPVAPLETLDELERALGADFAAPRRIALLTDPGRERITLESLLAQGPCPAGRRGSDLHRRGSRCGSRGADRRRDPARRSGPCRAASRREPRPADRLPQ